MGAQTATILVTDLVGSTELRVRLGEDDADALRRAHDDLLAAAVTGQGGTVVKGLGDGVLAMFPSSADAVAAAVAAQQAAHTHGRRHPDQALAIRVGISVGDVSVEDGDCFGTPVIEAARLCAAAEGGQVLAADLVEALARGRGGHEYRPVGELELKGLPDPVRTVEVAWAPATTGPGAPPPFPPLLHDERSVSFVGRPEALGRLAELWKEATAGRRRCALLAGEPGVGKTRLAAELARRAHDEGAVVLLGRCEEEIGLPFQPFVEALAYQVATTEPSAADLGRFPVDLARLYPELADLVPGLGEPAHGDPEVERHRMFEATNSWLAAAAQPAGLVLVLDDLHWAGKPTLLLLRHLLRSADLGRVLVIGTYRDTDLDRTHPLGELLADLRREPDVERLSLAGLTGEEVEAFVVAASGEDLDDDKRALAAAVHAETEGNAFFVGEVLRHLAESGAIVQRDGRWQAAVALEDMAIPEGVREVIGRRVSRLSEPVDDVLRWAAVVGRDVEFGVLADVVEASEEELLGALDEAVDARLVEEVGADRYRFVHALVRSTLLDEIRTTRRVRMHLRIAESLERRRPDDLAALAFHFGEAATATAGAGGRAVEYAGRAAAQAFARTAYDEAVTRYEQALELLDDLAIEDRSPEVQVWRLDLLLGLGRAAFARGGGGHEQSLADAFALATALDDGERMAEALLAGHRGWGSVAFAANAAIVADIEATLALLPTGDSVPRARLLSMRATEVSGERDDLRGRALQDEAVAMARRLGDDRALLEVVGAQWATLLGHRGRAEWDTVFDECFAVLGRTDDVGQEVSFLLARRDMLFGVGASTEADEVFERVLRFDPTVLPAVTRWMIANAVAGERLYRGAHDEAEPLIEQAFLLGQESGALDAFVYYGNHLLFLRHQQGRSDEVIELVADWLVTDPPGRIYWDAALAMLLAGCDRFAEARALYRDSVGAFPGHRFDLSYLPFGACLAHLAADLGEPDRAADLLEGLVPYRGELAGWRSLSTLGPVDLATGRLLTLLDRPDEALDHLAASAELCERGRLAPFLAMTRLAEGDAAHALGVGDAARRRWTEALDLATAGDYRTTMRRASAALASLPELS